MKQFKKGELVYIPSEKKKGKIISIVKGSDTPYLVEVIVSYNEETRERTTRLLTLTESQMRENRDKRERKPLTVKVKYFDNEIEKLQKLPQGDWQDLRAAETVTMKQGDFKLIPLGIGMKLPHGFEANVVPRSSTFKNFGILQTNSYGVIDNSYSGNEDEWKFPALAMRDTVIEKGDRICQFRLNRVMNEVEFLEVEFLDDTSRGGFGSTGTN